MRMILLVSLLGTAAGAETLAQDTVRSGRQLAITLPATVGAEHVGVWTVGGFDGAPNQGPWFGATVEGALGSRVALRVGVELIGDEGERTTPRVGFRLGLLRQETMGVDLGVSMEWKNSGFSESTGEIEAVVALGRRLGRVQLLLNLVYGQGLIVNERDAEVRAAMLVSVWRMAVGLDARGRFDLGSPGGEEDEAEKGEADLMMTGTAQIALWHLILQVNVGAHVLFRNEHASTGPVALAGLGFVY